MAFIIVGFDLEYRKNLDIKLKPSITNWFYISNKSQDLSKTQTILFKFYSIGSKIKKLSKTQTDHLFIKCFNL